MFGEYEYDCYESEMFKFEDGDVEVFTLPNHSEDHNITYDMIEDSVEDYYATMGYPNNDTENLVNLVRSLYNEGDEEQC